MSELNWNDVAQTLEGYADYAPTCDGEPVLDDGQRASVRELARRIGCENPPIRMALLADEVGMGKTRIAAALVDAVRRVGGRCAIVIPPGVGPQWQEELKRFNRDDNTLLPLRSYETFIAGFQRAEDAEAHSKGYKKERRRKELADRRAQRELPGVRTKDSEAWVDKSWHDESILMISHNFARMRFPKGGRRHLISQVRHYLETGTATILPQDNDSTERARKRAAFAIAMQMRANNLGLPATSDPNGLSADDYKEQVLPLIGYGLGQFDLIVVDEAHKTRGTDSSLSRILGPVTWPTKETFRLGMTATPVELDAKQWLDTIERISGRDDGMDIDAIEMLRTPIKNYVSVVERLQREELDEELVVTFKEAADKFACALQPYVLRRDKRDDPEICDYIDTYRKVDVRYVSPTDGTTGLTRDWLRRFAALEALSHLPQSNRHLKRLRLSIPQGLGLGTFDNLDVKIGNKDQDGDSLVNLWLGAIGAMPNNEDLYTHPAITTAVNLIESYTNNGEKVLVFGRFTDSMKALTQLLDAREMLRRLSDPNGYWPAEKIPFANIAAVKAAMRDTQIPQGSCNFEELQRDIRDHYQARESSRKKFIDRLYDDVIRLAKDGEKNHVARFLAKRWRAGEKSRDTESLELNIRPLLEALEMRLPFDNAKHGKTGVQWDAESLILQLGALMDELRGDDDVEIEGDGEGQIPMNLEKRLAVYLEAFTSREGNFARMMSGSTNPQTRRNLQAAFNRPASWPNVLVAQSQVGREGLNLHEACRTVVLLHSEWNPAIVEQQIGRVDRKECLWLKLLREWKNNNGVPEEMPRIMIHPIVVRGTYDDHNWQVLEKRWRELRGQLHGSVLPLVDEKKDSKTVKLRERVRNATPNFSPVKAMARAEAQ